MQNLRRPVCIKKTLYFLTHVKNKSIYNMLLISNLCAAIFLLQILSYIAKTDAKPLSKKIVKGKLHRYKRDLDILAECDLQCLQDDEIKDYELIIEYEYGSDDEDTNNFDFNNDNKKCAYACKILDVEKVEDSGSGMPGEISISFEDELLDGFKTNIEQSTSSSTLTSTTTSTTAISTTTTSSTIQSSTSSSPTTTATASATEAIESNFMRLNDYSDTLLKQCLALFASFGSNTSQDSSEHPCSYFEKKVDATVMPILNETNSLVTTARKNSSSLPTSQSVSYPIELSIKSTDSSHSMTPTTLLDSNKTIVEMSVLKPDVNQDIALRVLPFDGRISANNVPLALPPKRVIPKIIRYTVVEAEMAEEGSDGNSSSPEVLEFHQIDPEMIKLVDSSMAHISSGLASIKNMSKDLPLKNHYEFQKSKPKVVSHSLSNPSSFKTEESIPHEIEDQFLVTTEQPNTFNDVDKTQDIFSSTKKSVPFTARTDSSIKSTIYSVSSTTDPTISSISILLTTGRASERPSAITNAGHISKNTELIDVPTFSARSIFLTTERASERPIVYTNAAPISKNTDLTDDPTLSSRGILSKTERATERPAAISNADHITKNSDPIDDSPIDFPFIKFNPDIPRGHITRNKTRTVITSKNVTLVQTNQTFEFFSYALVNDGDSNTTNTSKAVEEFNSVKSTAELPEAMAHDVTGVNFAPKTPITQLTQSSIKNGDGAIKNTSKTPEEIFFWNSSTIAPKLKILNMPGANHLAINASTQGATLGSLINGEGFIKNTSKTSKGINFGNFSTIAPKHKILNVPEANISVINASEQGVTQSSLKYGDSAIKSTSKMPEEILFGNSSPVAPKHKILNVTNISASTASAQGITQSSVDSIKNINENKITQRPSGGLIRSSETINAQLSSLNAIIPFTGDSTTKVLFEEHKNSTDGKDAKRFSEGRITTEGITSAIKITSENETSTAKNPISIFYPIKNIKDEGSESTSDVFSTMSSELPETTTETFVENTTTTTPVESLQATTTRSPREINLTDASTVSNLSSKSPPQN